MTDLVSPEFLALDLLRLVSYLNLGFAATTLLILIIPLVCCALEQQQDRKARPRRPASRSQVVSVATIALLCSFASPELLAQSEPEVPTVEPTFTKLFGSDTLTIDPVTNIPPKASLSPNGKWIVFASGGADPMTLWIAPAEGGEPFRLFESNYMDHQPVWFPESDRIVFRSTRPSSPGLQGAFLMTVPIDTQTGRPTGPPRQISLERILQYGFTVSPDGKHVAYVGGWNVDRALRIIPSTGGTTRTVAEHRRIFFPVWAPDGRHVYYVARHTDTGFYEIMRVSVDGGTPEALSTSAAGPLISPDAQHLCREISDAQGRPRVYEIATIHGTTVARFTLPKSMKVTSFAADGRSLLAVMDHAAAPLRVLSLNGGPVRQLTETRAYDVPLAWTPDASEIFFETELNGSQVFMLAPRDGGAMRQVRLPSPIAKGHGPVLSADGRHVMLATVDEKTGSPVLQVIDLDDGGVREISRQPLWDRYRTFNPSRVGALFLYAERFEDRFEFRAVHPDMESILLRSFPADEFPPLIDVHDKRIAFTKPSGDSTSLFVAWAGKTDAKRVLTVEGRLSSRGSAAPSWSPDGSLLALAYSAPDAGDTDVLLVELTSAAEMVGEPRTLSLEPGPLWWWNLTWLPDGSGFVINGFGADRAGGPRGTNIWLVSLDPGTEAVPLTADDPNDTWAFSLSPDGRYLAYSSDVHAGSSVWRVELGDVLTGEK
jgi:Tol biopolymer transport system component